jgi:hypothetical protein
MKFLVSQICGFSPSLDHEIWDGNDKRNRQRRPRKKMKRKINKIHNENEAFLTDIGEIHNRVSRYWHFHGNQNVDIRVKCRHRKYWFCFYWNSRRITTFYRKKILLTKNIFPLVCRPKPKIALINFITATQKKWFLLWT